MTECMPQSFINCHLHLMTESSLRFWVTYIILFLSWEKWSGSHLKSSFISKSQYWGSSVSSYTESFQNDMHEITLVNTLIISDCWCDCCVIAGYWAVTFSVSWWSNLSIFENWSSRLQITFFIDETDVFINDCWEVLDVKIVIEDCRFCEVFNHVDTESSEQSVKSQIDWFCMPVTDELLFQRRVAGRVVDVAEEEVLRVLSDDEIEGFWFPSFLR